MNKNWLKNFFQSPSGEALIGNIAYYYLKFVGLTTRWKVTNVKETYKLLEDHGSMIVIGWHGRTLEMPYFWNKTRPLNALVSPHRDGRLIVNILKKFGIGNISGSSNQKSNEAALELMRNLQQGRIQRKTWRRTRTYGNWYQPCKAFPEADQEDQGRGSYAR